MGLMETNQKMTKNVTEEKLRQYNWMFKRFHTARQKWYNRGVENEELVYSDRDGTGTQYKAGQLAQAQNEKSIPITVNLLSAIKEQIQAFLTAFKPSMTALPVGRSAKVTAYVYKEICTALWYLNKVSRELDSSIGDSLTVGNGYLRVRPSNFFTSNDFNTIIEYVPWSYVYLDNSSKRIDCQDQEMMFIAIPLPASKAKKMYNLTEKEVEMAQQNIGDEVSVPSSETDSMYMQGKDDKTTWVYEIYEKEQHPIYILGDGRRVFEKPTSEGMSLDSKGNLIDNSIVKEYKETLVRYSIKVGNYVKYTEILPITKYPVVKFGCKWNKKPYDYPIVHDIIDLQKAFNTFLAITIANAQVASNAGWVGPAGSVDKAQFKKDINTPGGFGEFEPDASLPNGGAPVQKIPQPLANAWYTLMGSIISYIEYVTGIYGVIQGNGSQAPETLGATNSLQDLGTQRVKRQSRHIDFALSDLFDVVIECVQAYADENVVASYISGTDVGFQIETGIKGRMSQDGQFEQDENGQDQAIQITNLVTDEIKTVFADFKAGQYKVRFQNTSDLPTVRQQALGIIKALLAHMSSPEIAIAVAEQALDLMDSGYSDDILQKVESISKMQGQIQQLSSQVEELSKTNTNLEQEVLDREKELVLVKFEKGLNKTKTEVEHMVSDLQDKKKEQEKPKTKSIH